MWAKKNAVGKEQVAKLVDDTYRFAFCIMYFFHYLICNIIDGLESTDTAFGLLCLCPTCIGHGKRVGHGCMHVPAICFCWKIAGHGRYTVVTWPVPKNKIAETHYLWCRSSSSSSSRADLLLLLLLSRRSSSPPPPPTLISSSSSSSSSSSALRSNFLFYSFPSLPFFLILFVCTFLLFSLPHIVTHEKLFYL